MEENTTRIKNKLSVENNIIECLTYGSNVNISTAVKFQKQGNDFITFEKVIKAKHPRAHFFQYDLEPK